MTEITKELRELNIHGTLYKTYLTKKYLNRKNYEPVNEKLVVSFIPGTILDLKAKAGKKVKAGDPMLTLVAMKMENKLYFPFDGTIKSVNVKEGDRVPKGLVMVEYE